MKRFQFRVCNITKDRFSLNIFIYGGGAFIVVFKSDGPVVNN